MFKIDVLRFPKDHSKSDPYSYSTTHHPDPLFSNWTNGSFRSVLKSTNFSTEGSSSAFSDFDWNRDMDTFDVTFTLNRISRLDLSGELSAEDYNYGEGRASVHLYADDSPVHSAKVFSVEVATDYDFGQQYTNFSESITLNRGTYRLVIEAFTHFQEAYSSFNVQGSFSATHTTNGTPHFWMAGFKINDDTLDPDNDGMQSWEEFIASTNPTNAASYFGINYNATNGEIGMPSETGRVYGIEFSDNLVSNIWTFITNDIPGTGTVLTIPVSASEEAASYRGSVHRP